MDIIKFNQIPVECYGVYITEGKTLRDNETDANLFLTTYHEFINDVKITQIIADSHILIQFYKIANYI